MWNITPLIVVGLEYDEHALGYAEDVVVIVELWVEDDVIGLVAAVVDEEMAAELEDEVTL